LFYVLFVCKCVLPPGDNPIAVNKYIDMYEQFLLKTEDKNGTNVAIFSAGSSTSRRAPFCRTHPFYPSFLYLSLDSD